MAAQFGLWCRSGDSDNIVDHLSPPQSAKEYTAGLGQLELPRLLDLGDFNFSVEV